MALSKVCCLDKNSKQNKYRILCSVPPGGKSIVERNFYLVTPYTLVGVNTWYLSIYFRSKPDALLNFLICPVIISPQESKIKSLSFSKNKGNFRRWQKMSFILGTSHLLISPFVKGRLNLGLDSFMFMKNIYSKLF